MLTFLFEFNFFICIISSKKIPIIKRGRLKLNSFWTKNTYFFQFDLHEEWLIRTCSVNKKIINCLSKSWIFTFLFLLQVFLISHSQMFPVSSFSMSLSCCSSERTLLPLLLFTAATIDTHFSYEGCGLECVRVCMFVWVCVCVCVREREREVGKKIFKR